MYQRSGWLGARHDLVLPLERDARARLLTNGVIGFLALRAGLE